MKDDLIKIDKGLLPLSWLYGLGIRLRNTCFDAGIRKSRAFDIPVISVGNITVGGTGKTPHVEYLIRLLKGQYRVAMLSRGYKRKSKGFVVADGQSTARDIGDEPYQMVLKFPDITVAVDKKRVNGIERLLQQSPQPEVILLDDAFQHRQVKPGLSILLTDCHRLITSDRLLPAGRLREPLAGMKRADIIIVTKCPADIMPTDIDDITRALAPATSQRLFFTTTRYDRLRPVFNAEPVGTTDGMSVLLLTGIAQPRYLTDALRPRCRDLTVLAYPDHHGFTAADTERINRAFDALPSPRCIVTTEKDAARLRHQDGLSDDVRQHLHALPIEIAFVRPQDQQLFNQTIIDYVHKNSRDGILAQSKDDHKS